MASKIKKGLETANVVSAQALARAQIAVDKVLWGARAITNTPRPDDRTQTPEQKNNSAKKRPLQKIKSDAKRKAKRLLDRGLFQALEDLAASDLCNVLTYLYSQVGRPNLKRSDNPTKFEKALYLIQDQALAVQKAIDTFTTYPDRLVGKYITGGGFDPISQDQVRQETNTPTLQQPTTAQTPTTQGGQTTTDIAGTQTKKFNLVKLVEFVQITFSDVFSLTDVQGQTIYEPSEKELLTAVPEMQGALNFMNDILAGLNQYTDYRNISNEDFQKALKKVNDLRAICVLIQNLSIKDPTDLLNLVPPTAIQAQLERLQEIIDPADLVPFLKKVDDAAKAFVGSAETVQGTIVKGQTIIRIAIVLIKVVKLIINLLRKLGLAIPGVYTTLGVGILLSNKTTALERIVDDLVDILKQVNALIGVAISTIRYVQANALSLSDRLNALVLTLSNCDAIKDSTVLQELQQTSNRVNALQTTLQTILNNYDGRTTPRKATFGTYRIEVIDEEVVDEGITNIRRRGIALDNRGVLVLQSDLTFATDLAVIIQEVKVKLVAAGLVQPGLGSIDPNIAVITDSLSFLEENDLVAEDLNFSVETEGDLGLGSFVDGLPGGKRLRRRARARISAVRSEFKNNAAIDRRTVTTVYRPQQSQSTPVGTLGKYEVQIYENGVIKRIYNTSAASVDDATKQAKNKIDPNGYYPAWKYVAKKVG